MVKHADTRAVEVTHRLPASKSRSLFFWVNNIPRSSLPGGRPLYAKSLTLYGGEWFSLPSLSSQESLSPLVSPSLPQAIPIICLELSTVLDNHISGGLSGLASECLDVLDNVHTFDDGSKHTMLPIQP